MRSYIYEEALEDKRAEIGRRDISEAKDRKSIRIDPFLKFE